MAGAGSEYFDRLCHRLLDEGRSPVDARQAAFEAYLDGKPQASGKLKPTRHERDRCFWGSEPVGACRPEDWCTEAGTIVFARYLSQARVLVDGLVDALARTAPQALVLAMRRARLVLTPDAPHLQALRAVSALSPVVDESLRVHDVLVAAHRERQVELARCQAALADTTAFELLLLASLHAYEVLVPHSMTGKSFVEEHGGRLGVHWDAINDVLAWRLKAAPLETLKLDNERLGRSLKQFISPLLFPERAPPTELVGRMQAFTGILAAQIELNEFLSRSVDAHCFDDSVRFVPVNDRRLDLVETDPLWCRGHGDGAHGRNHRPVPGSAVVGADGALLHAGLHCYVRRRRGADGRLDRVVATTCPGWSRQRHAEPLSADLVDPCREGRQDHRLDGHALQGRGFRVLLNWQPPAGRRDAGEVDVIAARDGHLFILEINSTFIRRSMQDAWLHASTTLRKAGLQLRRKVEAVGWVVGIDDATRDALGLLPAAPPALVHGWIVDTSIESDHERFSGFLKVSLEEVIIALRDDRRLLGDPEGLVSGQLSTRATSADDPARSTLYPSGFDAARFVAVIENELVWEIIGRSQGKLTFSKESRIFPSCPYLPNPRATSGIR